MDEIKYSGLKSILKAFDEHRWIGTYSNGNWRISNGGYDLWFELYYLGIPVVQCIDGKLISTSNFTFPDKERLFNEILEVYTHLKVKNAELYNNDYDRVITPSWFRVPDEAVNLVRKMLDIECSESYMNLHNQFISAIPADKHDCFLDVQHIGLLPISIIFPEVDFLSSRLPS